MCLAGGCGRVNRMVDEATTMLESRSGWRGEGRAPTVSYRSAHVWAILDFVWLAGVPATNIPDAGGR